MKIIKPSTFYPISESNGEFVIHLDKLFFPSNNSITVKIESSPNEDFSSGVSKWIPTKICLTDGTRIDTQGSVGTAHKNKKVVITSRTGLVGRFYIRVSVNSTYHTNSFLAVAKTGTGVIKSKVITKSFAPRFISFHDIYETYGDINSLGLKVEVTNNASASSPVWENATEAYLNGTPYKFTNKPTDNFGIQVRISLNKTKRASCFCLYKMRYVVS